MKEEKREFDTRVQYIKYKVLREAAKSAWKDKLLEDLYDITRMIAPGRSPVIRCCVYKEREIIGQRLKLAMGGNKSNPNIIEVIDTACDECPMGGYEVTKACRGCLANKCAAVCKVGAITFDKYHVAQIDKAKCVECGACAKVCPYSAITNYKRPCEHACEVKAISMDENKCATIDDSKCIACGACVYQCPWGAIMDKSFILDVINFVKNSKNNTNYKVYAVVAPSIASQFIYATLGQVVSGIKELGFHSVMEVALGADIVAYDEAKELYEKQFLTSSCCPAFVDYIQKNYPELSQYVSRNPSPMAAIGKLIKEKDQSAKVVFIGPCTAKKAEIKKDSVSPYIDCVITFEELQALFDSKDIDIANLKETPLSDASYFGRIFARSGGLSAAVGEALKEQNRQNFELRPVACDGMKQCKTALVKLSHGIKDGNFIEGMACIGGCIGGAGSITHCDKSKFKVDEHSKESAKAITEAIDSAKLT